VALLANEYLRKAVNMEKVPLIPFLFNLSQTNIQANTVCTVQKYLDYNAE